MTNAIAIKGTREGLTITLGSGELTALLDDLARHLEAQGAFFRGGNVALRAEDQALSQEELARIAGLLEQHQMSLRTVVSAKEDTIRAAETLGLRAVKPEASPAPRLPAEPVSPVAPRSTGATTGVLVRQIVRSGQVIRNAGHVVVIGDVNPGGEIVAGGDVIIWGRLRGMVHAGAMGNEAAVVCALDLAPTQLRIGEHIARPADDDKRRVRGPEVATVRDGLIVVEPWDQVPRRPTP